VIRPITHSDIPEVAKVYMNSFFEADPSEEWTLPKAEALIKFFLKAQPDLAFLIERDGVVAGAVLGIVKPWWDGNCLVETEIFISPEFKTRGIGTSLGVHYLQEAIKLYDVRSINTITFNEFDFPASLYSRIGFRDKTNWKVMVADVSEVVQKLNAMKAAKA
jgi:L-amino acid N-acyltransferase YncA